MASKLICFLVIFSLTSLFMGASNAWLMQPDFYASSCPNVEQIVYNTMKQAVSKEPRMGASILRLFFHDCFVNGCDASVLLDDTPTFTGEKTAKANANNSIRGFEVIDAIKCNLEAACPQTVSCADILALASRDGVRLLGGPTWKVPLGRRDARTASLSLANQNLPPPRSSLANLTSLFARQNLNINEMTALSGGHTIGLARCINFRPHIYNDTDIDPTFAATRQANCPKQAGNGDFNLAPLDRQTPNKFDNDYFQNLVQKRGLLHSDQELYNGGSQDSLVKKYSTNQAVFFQDFVAAMIKMGNIKLLTGTKGEIRKNCRVIN
ncbi:peroxidase 4-like [Chenopodium quinoa]|uniref:Peroxidase n=3 Tax=Chenopodium quinoa TaxID=63459 RepID=A0A803N7H4_CHEQI|nr:peroxidase 4-like [Chenopodium quinoa]XP_021743006.1 peroxidase 4-like [Chenopodium quinoa]XP_021745401.1 peroxidase 4-like [Chenopodium quinoa]XP_021746430.1 peroxidase 4-like [Chenopodium quinoa]XP_021775075.1 peroxidase 4-like [Chenopodium quinoa]